MKFRIGQLVHSLDGRDDREVFFVVLEIGFSVIKIAEAGYEEQWVYRRPNLLIDATEEAYGSH